MAPRASTATASSPSVARPERSRRNPGARRSSPFATRSRVASAPAAASRSGTSTACPMAGAADSVRPNSSTTSATSTPVASTPDRAGERSAGRPSSTSGVQTSAVRSSRASALGLPRSLARLATVARNSCWSSVRVTSMTGQRYKNRSTVRYPSNTLQGSCPTLCTTRRTRGRSSRIRTRSTAGCATRRPSIPTPTGGGGCSRDSTTSGRRSATGRRSRLIRARRRRTPTGAARSIRSCRWTRPATTWCAGC